MNVERNLNDGFLYSASLLYLPTTFRASVYAGMEVLRRANGYRARWYLIPDDLHEPVPAYGQLEQQINVLPGSYFWGIQFSIPEVLNDELETTVCHVQITDACTETPIFSDYVKSSNVTSGNNRRNPMLLAHPALIGEPGLIDVEIYNGSTDGATPPAGVDIVCQLTLLMAEPSVPPEQIQRLLAKGVL